MLHTTTKAQARTEYETALASFTGKITHVPAKGVPQHVTRAHKQRAKAQPASTVITVTSTTHPEAPVRTIPWTPANLSTISERNGYLTSDQVSDSLLKGKAVYTSFSKYTV